MDDELDALFVDELVFDDILVALPPARDRAPFETGSSFIGAKSDDRRDCAALSISGAAMGFIISSESKKLVPRKSMT